MRFAAVAGAVCVAAHAAAAQSPQRLDVPTAPQQIALAVLPAPQSLRDASTVLGYRPTGELVTIRRGSNGIICLADDPREANFHASCYHRSLEPFMASGRALRARHGAKRELIDSLRLREIRAGRVKMPSRAVLYQVFAQADSVDIAAGALRSPSYLHVVYLPYATAETTGLTTDALRGTPWLMFPGKPWAHIMIVPR